MNKQRIAIISTAAITLLITLLPWMSAFSISVTGLGTNPGKITAVFAIALVALCLIGERTKPLPKRFKIAAISISVLAVILGVIALLLNLDSAKGYSKLLSIKFGFYLAPIASVLSLLAIFFGDKVVSFIFTKVPALKKNDKADLKTTKDK